MRFFVATLFSLCLLLVTCSANQAVNKEVHRRYPNCQVIEVTETSSTFDVTIQCPFNKPQKISLRKN